MYHEIHNELWASVCTMCFFLSSKLYFKGTLSDNAENSVIYLTRPVKSLTIVQERVSKGQIHVSSWSIQSLAKSISLYCILES